MLFLDGIEPSSHQLHKFGGSAIGRNGYPSIDSTRRTECLLRIGREVGIIYCTFGESLWCRFSFYHLHNVLRQSRLDVIMGPPDLIEGYCKDIDELQICENTPLFDWPIKLLCHLDGINLSGKFYHLWHHYDLLNDLLDDGWHLHYLLNYGLQLNYFLFEPIDWLQFLLDVVHYPLYLLDFLLDYDSFSVAIHQLDYLLDSHDRNCLLLLNLDLLDLLLDQRDGYDVVLPKVHRLLLE